MAKTAANLTDIINADALRALITEAAKSAAPEIKPVSELVEFTNPQTGETAQRAANVEALRDMARIYNASRADLPRNIYLYGGAGTGKSTLAADFADAINRPFYALTLGYDTTKSDILGYKTISGEYVSTPIIDAFEGGGRGSFGVNRFPPNPQKRRKRANAFPRESGRAKPREIRVYDVPDIFPHIHFYDD